LHDTVDQRGQTFVVDPVPVFDCFEVAKVNAGQRLMLIHQVKQLVPVLATIDIVVAQSDCHYRRIVPQTFDQGVKTQHDVVKREIKRHDCVVSLQNLTKDFGRVFAESLLPENRLLGSLIKNDGSEPVELHFNVPAQLEVFLSCQEELYPVVRQHSRGRD